MKTVQRLRMKDLCTTARILL